RFIPNTDRVGNQSKERTKSVGINIPVKINHIAGFDGDINVIIKPPLDPTYNKITVAESEDFNSQKNNFDNNAVFNLHAVFDDGSDRVLATFNPLPEEQRSSIRQYSVSYNSNFFGGSGLGHIGYSLYRTGSDGTLTFKTSGNVKATKFAISMENSDIGDDIKLCFGFENSDIIAKSTDGDFFAVYDKKMLWRANLYIKENNNDWNDN
ncbi:MAG: hypothetical protein GY756_03830, partial [bacterium]|nr:hypothetical protein [bacterium]